LLPVQAIEAAGLVVLGLAGAIALPFVPAGRILCWFLIAHGLLRMGLDSLRGDSRLELLGLSRVRWRAAWQILIGLWLADGARVDVGTFAVAAGAVSIVGCIALVQWRGDPRRRVMTDRHLMELRGLLAKIAAEVEDKAPVLRRSTLGVALAVSRGPPEFPGALHVSLSLPEAQEIPRLLCEVAADLCPGLWPEHCCLSPACVLHLLVRTDRWIGSNTDHGLADDLYGVVLRRSQACRPRAAS
jgi:hypothetical protein